MKNYNLKNLKKLSPVFLFRTLFFKNGTYSESYGSKDSTINKLRLLDNNWLNSLLLVFTNSNKNYKRLTLLAFFLFASVTVFGQQTNVTISTSATSGGSWSGSTNGPYTFTPSGTILSANIINSDIQNRLLGASGYTAGNVTIVTTNASGTGSGNVTFNTPITAASTSTTQRTFTVNAGGSITVSASSAINFNPADRSSNNPAYPGTIIVFAATTNVKISSAITCDGGAQTRTSNNNNGGNAGSITITGPSGISIYSNLSAVGGTSATATAGTNGTITINDGSSIVSTGGGVNDGQTAGVINGGAFTKSGSGTFVLAGSNTYNGLTTVSAGVLNIRNATATGTTAGGVTVASGAALQVEGGITVGAEPLTLNSTGISNDGALRSVGAGNLTNTWGGTITLGSTARINAGASSTLSIGSITAANISLYLGGIGNIIATGTIAIGSGSVTDDGPGNVTFSGNNTYTGATTISAGITSLGVSDVFNNNSNLILNGGTFKTGTSTGFSDTIGTLTLSANSTLALGGTVHTITFSASNAITWGGNVLTVNGWTGTGGSSGTLGQIIVGTTSSGLTSAQLAKFSFTNYAPGAIQLSTGEVVPTPAPVISSATTASSTYGTASSYTITGSNTPTSYSATGLPTGITVNTTTGVITIASTTAAGTYSISISATNDSGTGSTTLSYTVNTKALTVSGATTANKVYDGTNTATVTGGTLVGVVSPDVVTLTQSGTFSQTGVGTSIAITSTSSISGSGSANYSLTQPTLLARNITAVALTVTATGPSKTYGTALTAGTSATNFSVTGTLVSGEALTSVTLTPNAAGTTATTAAGLAYTVTPSLATGSGGFLASNYNITYTAFSGTVVAKVLSITSPTIASKVYNGTTTSGAVTVGVLSGFVGTQTVTATATGVYADANVGTGKTATITYTLANGANGGLATNYSLASGSGTGNITAKSLTIGAATIASKVYDGTTTSGVVTPGTLSGFVGTQTVTATATGVYANANVGTGKTATITYTLANGTNGDLATNYSLASGSGTGNITTKALTISGATITNKVYDGTNTATITGTLSGIVGSDVVTLSGTGTFSSVNVGTGISVTSTSTLTGTNSSNYTITQPTGLTGNITAKSLTIGAATIASKVYDGTTTSGLVTPGILSGFVGTQTVTATASGVYADANVGTGKTATITYTLANGTNGGLATNYSLVSGSGTGNITAKALTVSGATTANKVYDGNNIANVTGGTLVGIVGSDVVTLTQSGTFAQVGVGTNIAVASTSTIGGANASNYTLTQPTLSADITAKPITITALDHSKCEGVNHVLPIGAYTITGLVASESIASVTLSSDGNPSSAAVGTYPIVAQNASGGTFSPSNYSITYVNGTFTVNPNLPASVSIAASATTICSGTSVTFTATQTNGGTTPSYQWKLNGSNVGSNSATYTSTTLANNDLVTVVMTSNASPCLTSSPATSNTVTMTVNPNLPASVSIGASATTICSGTSVTFTATPTNGGTAPSYQWKLNGSNVGTDSATYTSATLTNNDLVTVDMTSNASPCLTGSPATSNTVTMTVNDPIGITAITPDADHISGSSTTTISTSGVVGSNAVVSWYTGSGQVGFLGTGLTSPAVSYGTYYAVVTGACGTSVELSTTIRRLNMWTGAVSNLWHVHGNWSEGIDPDANTDVIIETGKIVEINSTGLNNAYAYNITINGTSTLTVKSGNNLTLTDSFSTPAASSFVVESNANLIQLSAVTNTTPITVKRETSALKRLDYILWSSPVVGQNMLAFSPLTTLSPTIRFYFYNTSLNYYNSVPSPSTTSFTTGIGNLIRLPYNHPTAAVVWSGTFAGIPNNGTITVPVTSDPTDATKRYNLIGNPYPSPISIESFIDGNSNNIIAPLYFWRKTNGSTNKSYWAISKVGHTSSGEGTNPNGVIQVGQGFLVQAKANATQVVFNNSMRVLNNNNQFFKTTANNLTNNASRVWLKMTNATGDYSQALVGYFDNATLGIDEEIDAKDINDGVIGINSVINNVDYTIQGRPAFDASDVVPLSYKVTTAGSYTISIDQVDGLFTGGAQNIFLRDNVLGTCNNLTTSAYTFTSNPGSFQSRFELLYQNSLLSNNTTPAFNTNEVVIYHQKSDLIINTGVATMSSIKIFNIKGALLFDKKEINASETRVDIGSTNEVLLVEIVTTEGVKVVKKVYSELVIGSDDDE
jgi:hypothetical protein